MALARTLRTSGTAGSSPGTASWASASFTPTNSSLLVVASCIVDNGGGDIIANHTVSGGGWTYTSRDSVGVAGGFSAQCRIWTAPVTTGASMTLTFDCGASSVFSAGWYVWDFTGYDTGTPTGGSGTASTIADGPYASPTGDITLSAAPASGDYTVQMIGFDGNTSGTYSFTAGSGWTGETALSNTAVGNAAGAQYRTASTSTSASWTDPDTGSMSLFAAASIALVIKEGSGAAATSRYPFRLRNRGLTIR